MQSFACANDMLFEDCKLHNRFIGLVVSHCFECLYKSRPELLLSTEFPRGMVFSPSKAKCIVVLVDNLIVDGMFLSF